ncbi:hypothetical protein Tco_0398053 [Tanacetum coccineum]
MKSVKKSIDERALHKREYDTKVIERQILTTKEKVDSSKALDVSLVDIEITTHYFPKEREVASAKPHHMIAHGSSRYSSNDMVHNPYLEEAKKKTQESVRNSRPSVMPSAKSQSTTNGSKPKPRCNTQTSRNWPVSKTRTLNLSAGTSFNPKKEGLRVWLLKRLISQKPGFKEFGHDKHAMNFAHNSSELRIHDHNNEPSSSKLVPKVVPQADKTTTS